ncbi:putative protein-serine/threonine phosphatase [Rosa chinensis]|uniref:Calcineurin-like phosphoesterase domain-containing protein n=1 Tax=Rosa chinensis TaxID=74649 RepID=A0A2P6RZE1_ROSCH|nr:uncharacterized protein C630.12 isoform X2 [Rosa chinensis]PRQ51783.1 putative protein-serine/threonine phosphatase [Rosa chinensis]
MKLWELTAVLCLIWALTLLYGEMLAFRLPSLSTCRWPHHSHSQSLDYVKVAVLTDPQLTDRTSLPLPPKSLALELVQFYSDLYMRRAFLSSVLPFDPDVILFLGDYFDGGPYLSDHEWKESLSRLKHIFSLSGQERHSTIPVYRIPGNHDIGYEFLHSRRPQAIRRYEKEFGSRNYQFTVGKVEFIAIDSQAIDGNPQGYLASSTRAFVKNVSLDVQAYPRVLLTHIPLYRQDGTDCGPNRKSEIINQRINVHSPDIQEIVYQNYVTKESSNYLLDSIQPVLVLSGHDHDQCDVVHKSKYGPVKEHTLGTISWQQGNVYPSFMLLSASNFVPSNTASSEEAVLTQLCFLPVQLHIYIWYLSLFVLTLLALLLWPTGGVSFWHHFSDLMAFGKQLISSITSRPKEKDEDLNCEYEMMWDAEGSMQLVKKISNVAVTSKSETSSVERGTAVMRPTAIKNISQELEVSVNADADAFDPMAKTLSRASKSWTKLVIQRLVRTFRMVTIIAAVNVPIYMLLLFKDWID